MNVKKVAGACLLILGIAMVVHAIFTVSTGTGEPGYPFVLLTALLFILGAMLLRTSSRQSKRSQKAEGPSTPEN